MADKEMVAAGHRTCGVWGYSWAGVLLCTRSPHGTDEPHHDEELGVEWTHDGVVLPQRAAPVERMREGALSLAARETPERRRMLS